MRVVGRGRDPISCTNVNKIYRQQILSACFSYFFFFINSRIHMSYSCFYCVKHLFLPLSPITHSPFVTLLLCASRYWQLSRQSLTWRLNNCFRNTACPKQTKDNMTGSFSYPFLLVCWNISCSNISYLFCLFLRI